MVATEQLQQGFEERDDFADDEELIAALEAHDLALRNITRLRNELKAARDHAANTEDIYQALVKEREPEAGSYRITRFVLHVTDVEAHQRFSFEAIDAPDPDAEDA